MAIRCLTAICLLCLIGCTTTKTTNTARTGTEQLLISNAVDQALAKIDFRPMAGKKIYVEEKYIDSIDKGYVVSSVRHHVLHSGGQLALKPEEADIILELRSGGIGTDNSDAYVGVPGLTLPGMISLPDVKVVTRSRQSAYAKLGLVAMDAKTHQVLGAGGVSLAMSDDNNWYVMGVGPYRQGTMKNEVQNALNTGWSEMDSPLPNTVVFAKPPAAPSITPKPEDTAGRIQLTGGEEPKAIPTNPEKPAEKTDKPAAEKQPDPVEKSPFE